MDKRPSKSFSGIVPVPEIFLKAAEIAKLVKSGMDIKKLFCDKSYRYGNITFVNWLVSEAFKRDEIISNLIEKTGLLTEARMDTWLAKILIVEVLWGKNCIKRGSKPVEAIYKYEEEFRNLLPTCDQPLTNVLKPNYVRVNILKISLEEVINNLTEKGWKLLPSSSTSNYEDFLQKVNSLEPLEFMEDLHIPNLLIFPPKTKCFERSDFRCGHLCTGDKASCLAVRLLNPVPGSTVLCSAPGKASQLAAFLENSGKIYDVQSVRKENKWRIMHKIRGVKCVRTIQNSFMEITETDCPGVQYILVEPMSSRSGIANYMEIQHQEAKKLKNLQTNLLRHALNAFPQAERVVYTTSSIYAEENEEVVQQVLETAKYFKLIDARKILKPWNETSSDVLPELGKMCVYATPEKDKTDGVFVAVFERLKEGESNPFLNVELCEMLDKNEEDMEEGNIEEDKTGGNGKSVNELEPPASNGSINLAEESQHSSKKRKSTKDDSEIPEMKNKKKKKKKKSKLSIDDSVESTE